MKRALLAATALAAAGAAGLHAQDSEVHPGQEVRIVAPASGLTGQSATLLSATPDTVVVARTTYGTKAGAWWVDTTRIAVPRRAISSFEVRVWRSHVVEGALIGGAGLGFSMFVMLSAMECTSSEWICVEPSEVGAGTAVSALLGMGIGGLVGILWRSQVWRPVPLEDLSTLRVGIAPLPHGRLGVGLSLAF